MSVPIAAILSLARAGATHQAWAKFIAAGLDQLSDAPAALTLKGRLLKDRARAASASQRAAFFALSSDAYLAAAKVCPYDSYPLINAASVALFAGNTARAAELAHDVLALIASHPDAGETPYWHEATRAEALLLLGDVVGAQSALDLAVSLAPYAWEDHAATLRQFTQILTDKETAWLDTFRPPPTMHFSGILGIAANDDAVTRQINEAVASISPGFGYGAIAAGADILIAEALLALNTELHIVLPCDPKLFRAASVEPYMADWEGRYDRLLESATSLTICTDAPELTGAAIELANQCAMGMAVEKAAQLQCNPVSFRAEPATRQSPCDAWEHAGRAVIRLPVDSMLSAYPGHPIADDALHYFIVTGDGDDSIAPRSFPALRDALAALPADGENAAIDCAIGTITETDAIRIAAILRNTQSGTILASRNVAMAALAQQLVRRAEPMGEMAFVNGPLPIYAIMRA